MSAISHGWHPTGEAAGIPVKVAKEFHAADAGKKYGHKKKGYDRSSHHAGNPGFNRTEKVQSPPLQRSTSMEGNTNMGKDHKGYSRSPHMDPNVGPKKSGKEGGEDGVHTGYHTSGEKKGHGSSHRLPMEHNVPFRKGIASGDHFEAEIKEHFPSKGGVAGMHNTEMHHKTWETEDSKGHGKASGKAEHHVGPGSEQGDGEKDAMHAHAFTKHPQGAASHGYGHDHEQKMGHLRLSGHKSAHRIGKR